MPEPLKNRYNISLINALCRQIVIFYPPFDSAGFSNQVLDSAWPDKALKARMQHIAESLHHFLPLPYPEALQILMQASGKFSGFEYMFFPDFVERYGLDDYPESMEALAHFTPSASAEFAVRPFIKQYNERMMKQMAIWAESENHHLRRLASEGCRPRLPWAMALPQFKQDPTPILPILEKLKNDESEYVRRSVANNLNDIAKDHPQQVLAIAKQWLGQQQETDWVVKHGCRTLLKQGDPTVLALFGLVAPLHVTLCDFQVQPSVKMGEQLAFSFRLQSAQQPLGKLRIEYGLDFVRKNGKRSRKLFKISESIVRGDEKRVEKTHSFRPISTRKYYAGTHQLTVVVNGQPMASDLFHLN